MSADVAFNSQLQNVDSPGIFLDSVCRKRYDHRSEFAKFFDFLISIIREIGYVLSMLPHRLRKEDARFHRCENGMQWKVNSQGLYVLLHGLKGHPAMWTNYIAEFSEDQRTKNVDLFVPYVPKAGNCGLEEALQPIRKLIFDYATNNPGKPICLIGVSNGGRMADVIETEMRVQHPTTPMKILTMAAVHFGSSFLMKILDCGFTRWWTQLHEDIRQELPLGSQKAQEIIKAVIQPCPPNVTRDYEFFAATEDAVVPDLGSSLPVLGKSERHRIVHGYGHSSIVDGVREKVLKSCRTWMQQHGVVDVPQR